MPTILTHPAVPLAIGLGLGSRLVPPRLLFAGMFASIVPDFDVVSFQFGIAHGSDMGHRGLTHSILFALLVACGGALAHKRLHARATSALAFLFVAAVSHGVLDSFTNGGRGIAFLWPFSSERFFAPYRMIEVSPIGAAGLFTQRGANVLLSELLWVWLPCAILALSLWGLRRSRDRGADELSADRRP
jgi:inner membrane protein